jgi:hypothetical protein
MPFVVKISKLNCFHEIGVCPECVCLKKEKLWELPSVCGLNYPALFITGISLATNFLINL